MLGPHINLGPRRQAKRSDPSRLDTSTNRAGSQTTVRGVHDRDSVAPYQRIPGRGMLLKLLAEAGRIAWNHPSHPTTDTTTTTTPPSPPHHHNHNPHEHPHQNIMPSRQLRPRGSGHLNHSRSSSTSSSSSSTDSSFAPSPLPLSSITRPEPHPEEIPVQHPEAADTDLLSNITDPGYDQIANLAKPSEMDKISTHLGLDKAEIDFVRQHLRALLEQHPLYMCPTAIRSVARREEFCRTLSMRLRGSWDHGQISKYCCAPGSNTHRRNALYRLVLVERKLLTSRGKRQALELGGGAGQANVNVQRVVDEAVAAAKESVIALAHRLVSESNAHAERLATAAKQEAVAEAGILATAAKEDAISGARVLAIAAKEEAITEAGVLATAAKVEAITEARVLATTAKEDAIASISNAQEHLSDAILDIAAGQRQFLAKLDVSEQSAFHGNIYARLFPSARPQAATITLSGATVAISASAGTIPAPAGTISESATAVKFKAIAAGETNRRFSSRFLKLATEVLDGHPQLMILLGDSGTGKTYTTTGADGLIPVIFGRIIADAIDSDCSTISLEAKEYSGTTAHSLGETSASTSDIDATWLSTWLAAVTEHRTIESTALNQTSSRRHTVFRLHLHLQRAAGPTSLTICDMAGYERAGADPTPERTAIHTGLLKLGEILRAVAERRFEAFMVRGNVLTEGLRTQLVDLGYGVAGLTTLVMLDLADAERCARMLAVVNDYLPGA